MRFLRLRRHLLARVQERRACPLIIRRRNTFAHKSSGGTLSMKRKGNGRNWAASAPQGAMARNCRPKVPRVLFISADALACHGLKAFLTIPARGYAVCGHVNLAARAFAACLDAQPDAVLLDVETDGGGGWGLLAQVLRKLPGVVCVARVRAGDTRGVLDACRAGALGACTVEDTPASVAQVLRRAIKGRPALSRCAARAWKARAGDAALAATRAHEGRLAPRERQVFALVGEGLDTRAISIRMGISRKSVQAHCEHIKEKLGVPTFTALCQHAALASRGLPLAKKDGKARHPPADLRRSRSAGL
jgi:DNA-binding NarL/FixJ family response regulator